MSGRQRRVTHGLDLSRESRKVDEQVLRPVSPLAARFFGVYTFMASIVRAYAAYNITNRQ